MYALGECCELNGETVGLVAPIWQQVDVLAANLCGEPQQFSAQPYVTMLKVSGVDVHTMGETDITADARLLTFQDRDHGIYKKLIVRDERVVGALFFGDIADSQMFFNLIKTDNPRRQRLLPLAARRRTAGAAELGNGLEEFFIMANVTAKKLVVVGNGMVGHHFVEQMVNAQTQAWQITVIGAEPRPAYDRVHLSEVFAGKGPSDLALTTREYYADAGVEAVFGDAVASLDREQQKVVTAAGREFSYDKLVLATGSYPFVPPVPGSEQQIMFCLSHHRRSRRDQSRSGEFDKKGVVVGGGLLGLEAANALRNLGLETHVVEFAPQLMGVQVDAEGGAILKTKIEALGLTAHLGKNTQKIVAGEQHALAMHFADGEILETDMIVFSAGVRPDDKLARASGSENWRARRHRGRLSLPHQRRKYLRRRRMRVVGRPHFRFGRAGLSNGESCGEPIDWRRSAVPGRRHEHEIEIARRRCRLDRRQPRAQRKAH